MSVVLEPPSELVYHLAEGVIARSDHRGVRIDSTNATARGLELVEKAFNILNVQPKVDARFCTAPAETYAYKVHSG